MKTFLLLTLLALPLAKPNVPYRTDSANAHLPWYQLKAGEFPPFNSEHRVAGDLVEADFIHRKGQFRTTGTGELVDFTLLPFAPVIYLNAEADLRDVPLGTRCQFALYQDEHGAFTKVAAVKDVFSGYASAGLVYRVDKVNLGAGKLDVTLRELTPKTLDLGPLQLKVNERTRLWNARGKGKLSELAVGDELIVNLTGNSPQGLGLCADIWVGADSQKLAIEQQHARHDAFLRERGLAAWIDRVEGKKLTVTLFGDPSRLQALFKHDGIDPSQWAKEKRGVDAVVANEELRTYNPPVDRKRATVLEYQPIPTESHGCGGIRWVIEPDLLLEGFRNGRVIRLFVHPAWPVNDMPYGEGLYSEVPYVKPATEEPSHYPYRTDFANENLAWYRLRPGEFPPFHSHHLVIGELVKLDAAHRSGRLRTDGTGELVDFTMPPFGTVLYLNAEAELGDLPLGTRYHFFLHQDDGGVFTKATLIMDDFTNLAGDDLNYRIDTLELEEGRILLSKRHAPVKNDKENLFQPPDLGRGQFAVDAMTRVWKGDKPIDLGGLAVGDELLINLGGRTATNRGVCADIWVGTATQKLATEKQHTKHDAFLKENGLPAWIESVEGKNLTIAFFSASRKDFPALLNKDVRGDGVSIILADQDLHPMGAPIRQLRFKNQILDGVTGGTYGFSGVRWSLEAEKPDEHDRPGQILRVFREGWPIRDMQAGRQAR